MAFLNSHDFSKETYIIRARLEAYTIPAHNLCFRKFLHLSIITRFYIHNFLLKTQVHIRGKIPLTRIKSRFSRQQADRLNMRGKLTPHYHTRTPVLSYKLTPL